MRRRLVTPRWILRAAPILALGILASVGGCAGCRSKAPLGYVPADSLAVVVVPSLQDSLKHLSLLRQKLEKGVLSGALLAGPAAAVQRELGFDPQQPETLRKKGINPEQGLAVAVGKEGHVTVILGASDSALLDKYLREQVNRILRGAAVYTEKELAGQKMVLAAPQGVQEPLGGWTFVKGHVVIAAGKKGRVAEHLAAITKLEASIKDNPSFVELSGKVGRHDLLLYVDGGAARQQHASHASDALKNSSEWMHKYLKEQHDAERTLLGYLRGLAVGFSASAEGAAVRAFYAAPGDRAKLMREIFTGKGSAPPLAKYLAGDALLVGRLSLNLKKLVERALEIAPARNKRRVYETMEHLERDNQLSVDRDVYGVLGGRYAGGIFPPAPGALRSPPRSFSDLVGAVPVVLMAQIDDQQKASELLTRVERFLVMRHQEVRTRSVGDTKVYTLERDGQPLLSWALAKGVLVAATAGRLDATLQLIAKGGDSVLDQVQSPRAKKLLKSDDGAVLNYNPLKTVEAIGKLDIPPELKLMLSSALSSLGRFKDVTVAVEAEEGGIAADLSVTLN